MKQAIHALIFIISILLGIIILRSETLHAVILHLGSLDYIGAFLAGAFWVTSFTVIPSSAVLLILADAVNPIFLALTAGFGAMIGDYIIYRFFRAETDNVSKEVTKNHHFIKKLTKFKSIRWLAIIVGAFIIASPLPDELGIALLGITKIEPKKFLPLSFALNSLGIFIVVTLGRIF